MGDIIKKFEGGVGLEGYREHFEDLERHRVMHAIGCNLLAAPKLGRI